MKVVKFMAYEYKILNSSSKNYIKELNECAKKGWKISVVEQEINYDSHLKQIIEKHFTLLKRELK